MGKVIINADDFGLCNSVNEGIIHCFTKNYVNDFSFMVNPPNLDSSLKLLNHEKINQLGFHVNLTMGSSLLESKSKLCEGKQFPSKYNLFQLYLKGQLNEKFLYDEIREQFNVISKNKLNITHFDSHQNIHLIPPILKQILKIREEENLNVPIRFPYESLSFGNLPSGKNAVRILALNILTRLILPYKKSCTNIRTIGGNFFANNTGDKTLRKLAKKIIRSPYIYEIAVHPGFYSEEISNYDVYQNEREIELNILSSTIPKFFKKKNMTTSFVNL